MSSRASMLPSDLYPDYFKNDLGLGSATPHPIALALDEAVHRWMALSMATAQTVEPSHFTLPQSREVLHFQGIRSDSLTDTECGLLYEKRAALAQSRATLGSVRLLAEIYFGSCEITRGSDYAFNFLKGPERKPRRLSDGQSRDRQVTVRLSRETTEERKAEFITNAQRHLPAGYEVVVAPPRTPQPQRREGLRLAGKIRIQSRRI